MVYLLALDLGITSIGWAIIELDENDNPKKIIRIGSRIFPAAEKPKDGSSLAAGRREKRSMRRRLRRRRLRKEQARKLIIDAGLISEEDLDSLFCGQLEDIYEIRVRALDELLNEKEFVRLLIHYSQRRGFRSNRIHDSKSEDGKILKAVNANSELLEKYRTPGEALLKDKKFENHKRNKADDYGATFMRSDFENEISKVFEAQRKFGNKYATAEFEERFKGIILAQRNFDEGPGGNSPYAGMQADKMRGMCTFEKDEKRAWKAQYSFEYFNLLTKVNALKIVSSGKKIALNPDQRHKLINYCFSHKTCNYAKIRKLFDLSEDEKFNISYSRDKETSEVEEKTKFEYLKCYHEIKSAFKNAFGALEDEESKDTLNLIGHALSVYKTEDHIESYLREEGVDESIITIAKGIKNFRGTANLSVKACKKIIPFLEEGLLYNEACQKAGYDFKDDSRYEKSLLLPASPEKAPELEDITSPVVKRTIAQTIKVINAVIRKYSSPAYINIETARELAKNRDERNKIEKANTENRAQNEQVKDKIRKTYKISNPSGIDIVKLKLWEEQDGRSAYSGDYISPEKLFNGDETEIDHIIPYSISYDDSYNNKVLVLTKENREKGNKVPLQYLFGKARDEFIIRSKTRYRGKKLDNLLKSEVTEEDLGEWKERNLQDTKHISRFMLNYIRHYLQFGECNTNSKKKVTAVKGVATAYVRKRWGIQKTRENGDLHHAVDAVVIGCITDGMIKRISEYSKRHELRYTAEYKMDVDKRTGEVFDRFPIPYPSFKSEIEMFTSEDPTDYLNRHRKDLPNYYAEEYIEPVFVSRMPNRKVTGAAHKETLKSKRLISEGKTLTKVKLAKLSLKDGEILNYYNPDSDRLLYDALKARLAEFGGKGEKAFKEPFYKPKKDGSKGPLVRSVKVLEPSSLNTSVLKDTAVADNESMVRVDVFNKGGKIYLVPIYVSDTVKPELPNKAITRNKSYSNWEEMDDKDFVFSLYPNDLIHVISKDTVFALEKNDSTLLKTKNMRDFFAYYLCTDIGTASIDVITHDGTYKKHGLGVKTLPAFEKMQVDVLGNISHVKKEKRQGFKK